MIDKYITIISLYKTKRDRRTRETCIYYSPRTKLYLLLHTRYVQYAYIIVDAVFLTAYGRMSTIAAWIACPAHHLLHVMLVSQQCPYMLVPH